jgi:hypothetical protein
MEEIIKQKVIDKRAKYKEQGFADKDFEKQIGKKHLKLWLPNSVFHQQKLLMLASKIFAGSISIDEEMELTDRFYKEVCKHGQLDGNNIVAESLELNEIQGFALLYWVELLYPLSLWSDEKIKEMTLS